MSLRPRYYYLDAAHCAVPTDMATWSTMFGDTTLCRVGLTVLAPGVVVSTMFLGLDHNYADSGAPILYESMVSSDYGWDGQVRYATWAEAEAGHTAIVAHIRDRLAAAAAPG